MVADDHPAHRQIAAGQALGDRHQVRFQAVVLAAEPLAGAPEAADHLVDDEQDGVFGEDLAHLRPVAVRRDDHPAGALDRLGDEGGDILLADLEDLLLQLVRGPLAEGLRIHRAAFAVPVGLGDVLDAGDRQVALLVHRLHPAEAGAGHGGAVVAVDAADDHLLLWLALDRPVVAHQAQHGVVGLRAGAGEEHVLHARRGQLGDRRGQLDGRRVGGLEEQVVEGQLEHLPVGDVGQLAAAVADVDAPQAGHAVEDLVPLAVPQVDAVGAGDDACALGAELLVVGEGREQVLAAEGLPLGGGAVLGHCASP
ncbi:hypothetical protein D3C85_613380 [compost metagenome]